MDINNREWAILIWMVIALVWMVWQPSIRSSLAEILRTVATPKLLIPIAAMAAWLVLEVRVAAQLGLWREELLKDTIVWALTSGLVLFSRFDKASEPRYFRRSLVTVFEIGLVVEVYSSLYVFPLWTELIIQPAVAFVAMMSAFAANKPEYRVVRKATDILLASFGIFVFGYITYQVIGGWNEIDTGLLALETMLPVWLATGLIPYVYALGLYASYESAFTRIDWKSDANWFARARVKMALLVGFNVQANDLARFSGHWQMKLAGKSSYREGRKVVRAFLSGDSGNRSN